MPATQNGDAVTIVERNQACGSLWGQRRSPTNEFLALLGENQGHVAAQMNFAAFAHDGAVDAMNLCKF
jgi:hypothetical protein